MYNRQRPAQQDEKAPFASLSWWNGLTEERKGLCFVPSPNLCLTQVCQPRNPSRTPKPSGKFAQSCGGDSNVRCSTWTGDLKFVTLSSGM